MEKKEVIRLLITKKAERKTMNQVLTHDHSPRQASKRSIKLALGITASFFAIELLGAFFVNSLALLADAWHMLNDTTALSFALVAAWIADRPKDLRKTYGYFRAEILASFLNGVLLLGVVIVIFYNASLKSFGPTPIRSAEMLTIAFSGLIANGLSAFVLSHSQRENLNTRGVFLHVVSDLLGSVAAIISGLIVYLTGWLYADPIFSVLIGLLIFYSAFKLVRESANILLEGVPRGVELEKVEQLILQQKNVKTVHDLHIWCITPTDICALSCHIVVEEGADRKQLTANLMRALEREFGINHTTIQLEEEGYPRAQNEHWTE